MIIELAETGISYGTSAKSWSPPLGKKWRLLAALGTWTAGSRLTAGEVYAIKQLGGSETVLLFSSGNVTPGAAGDVTYASMSETGNGNPGAFPLYTRIHVTAVESIVAAFGGGALLDTYSYEFVVDETDDNGEP